jgi:hypothetical protein
MDMLKRAAALLAFGAMLASAHAAETQSVAPVTLPPGGHGVDGPFFPTNRVAPIQSTTGQRRHGDQGAGAKQWARLRCQAFR